MPFFHQPFSRAVCPRGLKWVATCTLVLFTAQKVVCSPVGTADYLIDLWTSDNGLPDSSVTAIAQTPDGYLWIGTYNGLARFDGVQFVDFDPFNTPGLKSARVDGLFVDAQGTLWINTHDGSMTAWRNGAFTREWQGGQVSAVYTRSNQIFFVTLFGQLACRNGNLDEHAGWQPIQLAGTAIGDLFRQDGAGDLWYATRDGALNRIVGTNSEPISSQEFLPGEIVTCLTTDGGGRIWVGTDKRILRWRGDHFEDQTPTNGEPVVNVNFFAFTASNGCWVVADGKVRECVDRRWVAEADWWQDLSQPMNSLEAYNDQDRGVWFRQFGSGLFHAKPDGSTQRISAADGLPGDRVSTWFQDREGNIWAGVDRGGLVRLRGKRFHVIGAAEGLSMPAVSTVCEDGDSNVWIGTFGGGLNRWRDGVLTRFNLSDGGRQGYFFSAYPDTQGRVWLSAGREDLFVLETNRISNATTANATGKLPMPSDGQLRADELHGIKVILVDHLGQTWMGRHVGLTRLANGVTTIFGPENGFVRTDVRAIAEDSQGNIWIGGDDGVLYQFAGGKFTAYRVNDSVGNQAIWSLLPEADGALWVGTFRGGLLRFRDGKFTRYTMQSGLPNDIICQILDDGIGNLWIGSHKGIFYFPKDSLKDFDAGKIPSLPCIAYGLYDGLPTLECSGNYQPSCWHGHDGTLWFATAKGLVSIRPDAVSVNRQPPPVVIEDVFVDGKPVALDTRHPTPGTFATPLQIPPGKHQFDFQYTALSFAAPDKVRFRYRLEGLDEGWVEADGKRSAHYGPLRQGEYHFQVIACNNDGIWNETGSTINLKVLPHFWETWWFDCLAGLFLMSAIFGAVRFVVTRKLRRKLEQLGQQRAIERERERIAKDIHDDLGAGLTQIMLQSALARREPQEQTQTHLAQISGTALELVSAMDEIVWAINPENDTLDGLVTYVGKYVEEYVAKAGMRCRLDLPAQVPAMFLSAEVRHNLFLAIKEALNNAVKHAQAAEISFSLKLQPHGFSFVIKDDGRGLVPDATRVPSADSGRVSSGHGLRNLVQRLEKIGGTCTIKSEPGKGTEVELTVRLQNDGRALKSSDAKTYTEAN